LNYIIVVPQQMGMLFMVRQQVQPDCIIVVMHSQQLWIILQQAASPEVHMILQPFSVISVVHIPIVRLQQHTIMPFIIMQQPIIEPDIMVQRFCIMLAAIASSHVHVRHMPVLVFSIFMVQRGIIIMLPGIIGGAAPPIIGFIPAAIIPGMPMRSIIMLAIAVSFLNGSLRRGIHAHLEVARPCR
jgi:hypothetical protein